MVSIVVWPNTFVWCQVHNNECSQELISRIDQLRVSFDSVQYITPSKENISNWKAIIIKTQKEWDNIENFLLAQLKKGEKNIEIRIEGKDIVFCREQKEIVNWNYPDVNIRILGKESRMQPSGVTIRMWDKTVQKVGEFYSFSYPDFNMNEIILDKKGDEISLREETKQVEGDIVKAQRLNSSNALDDVWKFEVDLLDLSEEQCTDFYVLMTRDWTSARHKVLKVQDGWLYYHLDSEDLHSDRNPNVDWTQYGVRPRYTLINNPVSKGVHYVNGRFYIPKKHKKIRINKKGNLITFAHCCFNSLEIMGFDLNGCSGSYSIGLFFCNFLYSAFIHSNSFSNFSSIAIGVSSCKNVVISDNIIRNTRGQAIEGGGENITICENKLSNIGWMLNTQAITGAGDKLHICDNLIENFNYSAISCGGTKSNTEATRLTYIIERNEIRLSKKYADDYIQNTLADGGGIYIEPQCSQGIIRYNVIKNINGIHSNRGILLDDGAKNLAIYGNLIINTANSYDIDLRLCESLSKSIPDHNTNNCVFQNIMTGGYRFQDRDSYSNCYGGENVLLGTGRVQTTEVDINHFAQDQTTTDVLLIDGFVKKHLKASINSNPKRTKKILVWKL